MEELKFRNEMTADLSLQLRSFPAPDLTPRRAPLRLIKARSRRYFGWLGFGDHLVIAQSR